MVVFQKYFQTALNKILDLQYSAFNGAVNNALILRSGSNHGDFVEESFMLPMANLIHHRDPRADSSVATIGFEMDKSRSVKTGRRIGPVEWTATEFKWIQEDPKRAAVALAKNVAEQKFRTTFDLALAILAAAMGNNNNVVHDITGETVKTLNYSSMNTALSKFGDAYQRINTWLMHSKPMFDLFGTNLANEANLFSYSGVIVKRDPFGNPMIMSDSPSLVDTVPSPDEYISLGLTPGSIIIEENNDYVQELVPVTQRTNIKYVWQAEYSINIQVKNYSWDSTNGGKAPNDAALVLNTNWDVIDNTTVKVLPGVKLITR